MTWTLLYEVTSNTDKMQEANAGLRSKDPSAESGRGHSQPRRHSWLTWVSETRKH